MKYWAAILVIATSAASCGSTKPAATPIQANGTSKKTGSIEFINNVSLKPASHRDQTGGSATQGNPVVSASTYSNSFYSTGPGIENYAPIQFKYAILMDAPVEEMNNQHLLQFIDEWYGTRYRYGGSSKDGIDCSAFVASLMASVYGVINLPRISKDQYNGSKHVPRRELQEGDLVFFHTLGRKKEVTHVGMYLRNSKFIHASISGVMISSLDDPYYSQHYVGAGRVM